ncbi:hypothetical protein ACFL1Z_07615 [Thermodesulfobacteriota bacterium]
MKRTSFNQAEIKAFQPSGKIGLVASINPEGLVHITLITSIMASSPTQMTLGQFCTGRGKWFIQENNKLGFLIMTLDRRLWRGKARWTHKRLEGPEYEIYNEMPMFRYNTYFGINTVHYLDLVETGEEEPLPLARIIPAAIMTKLSKGGLKTRNQERILKPFAEDLFNNLGSLTFLAYLGGDGYPVIIPVIQCQATDSRRLAFSTFAYDKELSVIKAGTNVSVFCCNLSMQSVLIRGTFTGIQHQKMLKTGVIDIEWVYNSMPPIHEQIYPEVELKQIVDY